MSSELLGTFPELRTCNYNLYTSIYMYYKDQPLYWSILCCN